MNIIILALKPDLEATLSLIISLLPLNENGRIVCITSGESDYEILDTNCSIDHVHSRSVTAGTACATLLMNDWILQNPGELLIVDAEDFEECSIIEALKVFRKAASRSHHEEDQGLKIKGGIIYSSISNEMYNDKERLYFSNGKCIVGEVSSKIISKYFVAGVYWFNSGEEAICHIKQIVRKGASEFGEFKIGSAFNEIILSMDGVVGVRAQANMCGPSFDGLSPAYSASSR